MDSFIEPTISKYAQWNLSFIFLFLSEVRTYQITNFHTPRVFLITYLEQFDEVNFLNALNQVGKTWSNPLLQASHRNTPNTPKSHIHEKVMETRSSITDSHKFQPKKQSKIYFNLTSGSSRSTLQAQIQNVQAVGHYRWPRTVQHPNIVSWTSPMAAFELSQPHNLIFIQYPQFIAGRHKTFYLHFYVELFLSHEMNRIVVVCCALFRNFHSFPGTNMLSWQCKRT